MAKIWLKITIPLSQTASSLGRFWRDNQRQSGAVVLSLDERPSPLVPPPREYALKQISPPTSFAQGAFFFYKMNEIRIHPRSWGLWVAPRVEYQFLSLNPQEAKTGGKNLWLRWGVCVCVCVCVCVFQLPKIPCLHHSCSLGNISTPDWKDSMQIPCGPTSSLISSYIFSTLFSPTCGIPLYLCHVCLLV
ncbi:hypothetical protein HJG60_011904 [Phyllostomus discolor]|uniref:Uncharacterized protein n=1 Tax=Phyllostomus discolor TaxID=89673 RepID=A0A833ZLL5_9CHIR|nr:hypothetical protein HJG60_011904 [Phyllostomus discolor]